MAAFLFLAHCFDLLFVLSCDHLNHCGYYNTEISVSQYNLQKFLYFVVLNKKEVCFMDVLTVSSRIKALCKEQRIPVKKNVRRY